MRPVASPPPDGRLKRSTWRWREKIAHAREHPGQWFEVVGVPKSSIIRFKEDFIDRNDDFYMVTRNWREGKKISDVYFIYSPGRDPEI